MCDLACRLTDSGVRFRPLGWPIADENNFSDWVACDLGRDIRPYLVVRTLSGRRNQTAEGVSSVGLERSG
jgi:hypothetical protein